MPYLMENIPNLKLMKANLLLLFVFSISISFAQVSNPIVLKDAVSFSKDRYDNVFYVTTNQDVKKYGDDKLIYSPQRRKEITNLEAWNSIKIFLFSKEYQEYTVLDKYLTEIYTKAFNIENVGFASFATISLDGNIWLFDNSDFSIKKVDIQNGNIISKTPLNLIIKESQNEVLFMKEYGNFLYISTANNGILVFDNLGTYKKKLPFNNVLFFDFTDNTIYFQNENSIKHFNLIKLETTQMDESTELKKIIQSKKNTFIIK